MNRVNGSKFRVGNKTAHNSLTACGPAEGPMVYPYWTFQGVRRSSNRLEGTTNSVWGLSHNGWSDGVPFLGFLRHFVEHMKRQALSKALMYLDGAHEHKYIPALEYAKANNIVLQPGNMDLESSKLATLSQQSAAAVAAGRPQRLFPGGAQAVVVGQQQVVIKSLEANYTHVPGIAAATILGDGRVAWVRPGAAQDDHGDPGSCG